MKDDAPKSTRPADPPASSGAFAKADEPLPRDREDGVRKEADGELTTRYRVWRCNGVPVGLRIHDNKKSRRHTT